MKGNPDLRQLPGVDELLCDERIATLHGRLAREFIVALIRNRLADIRKVVSTGGMAPSFEEIVDAVVTEALDVTGVSLQPVINATGVILHTNLGRSPISAEALQAAELASGGYCTLEFNLARGRRDSRQAHVESMLCLLTGADAALVVNNNASAVLLALSALARRKEVIVSRGQAVEIGGGFRIPDVMHESRARMVEVGTTNRSYIGDYEQAINPRTAALLRVHASNFKISGFTHLVSLEEMVELGRRHDIMTLDDIGSGCLIDTTEFGLDPEPQAQHSIAAGADLTFFSGDKLLGGPQAGIIVGRGDLVKKLAKHPLARAMRIDKASIAALSVTLNHYLKGEALDKIPVLRLISTPLADVERRARTWAQFLGEPATVVAGESVVGGGSLPGGIIPTRTVAIRPAGKAGIENLARRLRQHEPPVVARVEKDALLLDPRSVFPEQDEALLKAVSESLGCGR